MAHRARRFAPIVTCLIWSAAFATFPLHAAPTPGFIEQWAGTSTSGWGGGAGGTAYNNPGTGGVLGDGDGYLEYHTLEVPNALGARSTGAEYAGNWQAAGISGVRLWLMDVGDPNPLQLHFAIGNRSNFWQYNSGFSPGATWSVFEVDLTDATKFTRIIGNSTFDGALQTVDRILVRHDLAPYIRPPNLILADVGLDGVELLGEATATRTRTWGRVKALYR